MTIPIERARAVLTMRRQVENLCPLVNNPRTKKADYIDACKALIRVLRHYPYNVEVEILAKTSPDTLEIPPEYKRK